MTSIYRGQKPRSLSSFFSIWPPTQNEDYTSSTTTCLEEDGRRGEEVTSGVPVIYIKELFTHGSKPFVIIICGRGHFVKKHMLVGGSGVEVDCHCHQKLYSPSWTDKDEKQLLLLLYFFVCGKAFSLHPKRFFHYCLIYFEDF